MWDVGPLLCVIFPGAMFKMEGQKSLSSFLLLISHAYGVHS